jgi:predicted nucleic acid-binding Zn ribbon protein
MSSYFANSDCGEVINAAGNPASFYFLSPRCGEVASYEADRERAMLLSWKQE